MSNEMHDDELAKLARMTPPTASDAARQRALDAAMLAFDAEQAKASAPQVSAQGSAASGRLSSMFASLRRTFAMGTMNTRLSYGLGTAAVALLLLPLGYQLYSSTAMSPLAPQATVKAPAPIKATETPEVVADVPMATTDVAPKVEAESAAPADDLESQSDGLAEAVPSVAPAPQLRAREETSSAVAPRMMAPPASAPAGAMVRKPAPAIAFSDETMMPPPEVNGDMFTDFDESPVKVTAEQPVSTFSIDVDTASYAYVRRALGDGYLPPADAVRIEELINYFDYAYPGPDSAETPFQPSVAVFPTPWNPETQLVRIGIKGYVPPLDESKPKNLTFLIDTSGSMDDADKLPLLKRAFALLVDQLGDTDTVSLVAYAGSAGVVLPPTAASDKAAILGALDRLYAGGSTAGAAGIELAYDLAEQSFVEGGINRVILATDGDFNVGIDDPDQLVDFIKTKRDDGVFLSVLGFGSGNLGDDTMQALAQNGNGNASYIDSFKEAQKVLVSEIGGTLETIAKDVKMQVEFNPGVVSEYRLIGYETRALNREDFNNDKVDAGDIGAGHTVTALYEITPVGSSAQLNAPLRYGTEVAPEADDNGEIGYLKLRYKQPEASESQLIEMPIAEDIAAASLAAASDDSRFAAAVAAFGQKLKGSVYGGTMRWNEIRALAQGARGEDEAGYRAEFVQLIDLARALEPDPNIRD
ncbi:YfbK domain-containing protein [Devosia sp.]|uniref:vWA domain-containing protein n=1 Tax=Devosia sp. TaxID=1871048 RepID=UPI003A90B258